MRVSLCLSGMPRNIDNSYQWLKDGILDVLKDNSIPYDIFVSTWNNNVQKEGDSSVTTVGNSADDFIKVFSPKKFEVEEWDDNIRTALRWPEFEQCKYEIIPRSSALGQWYKVFKCNELRKQYELENNVKYDVIFRIRTEIQYNNKLDFKELEILEKHSHEPIIFLRRGPNPQNIFWTKDTFAFGNELGMNIYSNCHNHFVNVCQATKVSTSELGLRNWLYNNPNLKIEHTSLDYTLIRN